MARGLAPTPRTSPAESSARVWGWSCRRSGCGGWLWRSPTPPRRSSFREP